MPNTHRRRDSTGELSRVAAVCIGLNSCTVAVSSRLRRRSGKKDDALSRAQHA